MRSPNEEPRPFLILQSGNKRLTQEKDDVSVHRHIQGSNASGTYNRRHGTR